MPNNPLNPYLSVACNRLGREVRDHPLLTLGLAVGVGALVGAIAGQAAAGGRKSWLGAMSSGLSNYAHEAGNGALRTSHQKRKELHAAANRATAALPEMDLNRLTRRGRQWLRSKIA